jgi:hypothetical protein
MDHESPADVSRRPLPPDVLAEFGPAELHYLGLLERQTLALEKLAARAPLPPAPPVGATPAQTAFARALEALRAKLAPLAGTGKEEWRFKGLPQRVLWAEFPAPTEVAPRVLDAFCAAWDPVEYDWDRVGGRPQMREFLRGVMARVRAERGAAVPVEPVAEPLPGEGGTAVEVGA